MLRFRRLDRADKLLFAVLPLYSFISVLVLIVNILTGVIPPTLKYSISINVGCSIWSSVLYLLCNCFNSYCLVCFFRKEGLPKLYRYFGYFVVVFLMLVSMCPIGLINETFDYIHNVFARIILLSLVAHTFIGAICFRHKSGCLIPNLISLSADACMIAIFVFFPKLFWSCAFVWEFVLIVAYFSSLLFLSWNIRKDHETMIHNRSETAEGKTDRDNAGKKSSVNNLSVKD